ncbi:MAG: DUF6671 family protein [Sphingomonadales bacterium]
MFPSRLLISSKHHKDKLLAPLFKPLGTQLYVDPTFDTDLFGTFCGEIPRKEGPKTTVREKCLAGMSKMGVLQGLASEGSFGPHPQLPFLNMNEEWLVYIDLDKSIEIYGHASSLSITFQQLHYSETQNLKPFLEQINFGSQGLQLKDAKTNTIIQKGITTREALFPLLEKNPQWLLETDLRAHLNPKRQQNILAAAQNLIARSQSLCPNCEAPDFWMRAYSGQLPCCMCRQETQSYQFMHYTCRRCNHEYLETRKDKSCEDPQFCPQCNP